MSRECVICSVLSHHNERLKWLTSIQSLGQTVSQLLDSASHSSVLQLCVTAQFYLENKGKCILSVWGHADPKEMRRGAGGGREGERAWERETPSPLAPLFMFFLRLLSLPYVNWASQECCLFYLRPSLLSLDLLLFYFRRFFPSLSFSHCHSGLLFPILTT